MNTDYTHITYIIDRSGSMSSCWTDTIGGLKSFIEEQKRDKAKCTFSLVTFDGDIETNLDFVDIQEVSEDVDKLNIYPRGSTALYDAIGLAVTETGQKLAQLSEDERPGRVIVNVITDGQENVSKEYKSSDIKKLIDEHTEKYSWTFMFVGADQSAVTDASQNLGFSFANTTAYSTGKTSDTFNVLNSKMSVMRSASFESYAKSAAFSETEKKSMI